MIIDTVEKFDLRRREMDRALFGWLFRAMWDANAETAALMQTTTRFRDVSGALRAGIGERNRTIVKGDVTKPDAIVSTLGIQTPATRKYAWVVAVRTGFTIEALDASEAIYLRHITDATNKSAGAF